MTEQERIHQIIQKIGLFSASSADFIDALAAQSRIHTAQKGKILFISHDEASHFFIILKGWVKLFRETLDGAQAVVDILPQGHMFGETCIFEDNIYSSSAEAVEPLEYIALPVSFLKAEIERNPQFAFKMLGAMTSYRKQQDEELEHRTLQNAPQRIGCFLLRLADQSEQGAVTIHLPYDKTLLASRLGMQPETFSRALAKLKDATGIRVKGATIEMDSLTQLSSYSCSACSSEFPCKDLQHKKKS